MRDDFTKKTRELLGNKVGWRCSNPNCRKLTRGAATGKKYADIGVAAHIKAASKGGKRYDDSMSPSERKDYDNGIWLCQNCAKLIDSNEEKYTVELLHSWKDKAEKASSRELEGGFFENAKMMTYHAVYSLKDDEVVGREKEKEDIISYINHGTRIFNVHGMPGIGKSTICYYALQEYAECEGYLLFEIGVRGCDLFQLFMAKMAETFGCDQKKNIETRLLQVISEYSKDNIVILYYDNFEDCLSDNETIKFLDRVIHLNCNIRIILSTRETIGGTDNYLISPMSLEVCYKLFERKVNAINSGLVMDKSMAMDFIENKLDKHTESIILVAANSDGFCSLDEMIKMWESERDYLLDENGKEISLTKSVGFSYNRIKGSNLMVAIWGCFPFFQYEISEEVIYELFSDCKNECKQALLKLVRKELIKRTDYGYQMLQPIRDRIYKLAPEYEFEVNERKIHNRVIDFYINKNRCTDYYGEAVYALRFAIKQINAVTNEEKTKKIIQLMYPYAKKFPYDAVALLEMIPSCGENDFYLAEAFHCIGKNEKALGFYASAIECTDDKRIIANSYNMQCEIKRLEGNRSKALELVEKAERLALLLNDYELLVGIQWQRGEIYRLIDKDMDNALNFFLELIIKDYFEKSSSKIYDVYWSIGEIYLKRNDELNAKKFIDMAFEGYKDMNNNIGQGYAYLSLGLLRERDKSDSPIDLFDAANRAFKQASFELGCGHSLKYKGEYLKRIKYEDAAIECLKSALQIYEMVNYRDGVSEVESLLTE